MNITNLKTLLDEIFDAIDSQSFKGRSINIICLVEDKFNWRAEITDRLNKSFPKKTINLYFSTFYEYEAENLFYKVRNAKLVIALPTELLNLEDDFEKASPFYPLCRPTDYCSNLITYFFQYCTQAKGGVFIVAPGFGNEKLGGISEVLNAKILSSTTVRKLINMKYLFDLSRIKEQTSVMWCFYSKMPKKMPSKLIKKIIFHDSVIEATSSYPPMIPHRKRLYFTSYIFNFNKKKEFLESIPLVLDMDAETREEFINGFIKATPLGTSTNVTLLNSFLLHFLKKTKIVYSDKLFAQFFKAFGKEVSKGDHLVSLMGIVHYDSRHTIYLGEFKCRAPIDLPVILCKDGIFREGSHDSEFYSFPILWTTK